MYSSATDAIPKETTPIQQLTNPGIMSKENVPIQDCSIQVTEIIKKYEEELSLQKQNQLQMQQQIQQLQQQVNKPQQVNQTQQQVNQTQQQVNQPQQTQQQAELHAQLHNQLQKLQELQQQIAQQLKNPNVSPYLAQFEKFSQQEIPLQYVPQPQVPQQHVPQPQVPQQHVPQQHVPQQHVPQPQVPQQHVPQPPPSKLEPFSSMISEVSEETLAFLQIGPTVILFYAPWCVHCVHFKPIYEQIAKTCLDKKLSIRFAALDGSKFPKIVQDYKLKGYPTLGVIRNSEFTMYSGQRNEPEIMQWIEKL